MSNHSPMTAATTRIVILEGELAGLRKLRDGLVMAATFRGPDFLTEIDALIDLAKRLRDTNLTSPAGSPAKG